MGCPAECAHAWMWVSSLLWGRHRPASGALVWGGRHNPALRSPSLRGNSYLPSESPSLRGWNNPTLRESQLRGYRDLYSENPQSEERETALTLTVPQSEGGNSPALRGLPVWSEVPFWSGRQFSQSQWLSNRKMCLRVPFSVGNCTHLSIHWIIFIKHMLHFYTKHW